MEPNTAPSSIDPPGLASAYKCAAQALLSHCTPPSSLASVAGSGSLGAMATKEAPAPTSGYVPALDKALMAINAIRAVQMQPDNQAVRRELEDRVSSTWHHSHGVSQPPSTACLSMSLSDSNKSSRPNSIVADAVSLPSSNSATDQVSKTPGSDELSSNSSSSKTLKGAPRPSTLRNMISLDPFAPSMLPVHGPASSRPRAASSTVGTTTPKSLEATPTFRSVSAIGAGAPIISLPAALSHSSTHSKPKDQEVYLAIKTIGEGSFGAIKLAKHAKTGKMVAIKSIDRVALKQSSKAAKMVVAELATLLCLGTGAKETCLLPLLDVYATSSSILLVFPYAEHGDLFEWLKRQPGSHVGLAGTRRIFSQLVDAVAFMHVNGFCHRDLKPENVLVINSPSRAAKAVSVASIAESEDTLGRAGDHDQLVPAIMLADFGFSSLSGTKDRLLRDFVGSGVYVSPEIINRTPYRGPEVDAWSLGVILYTLASGRFPYSSGPDLAAAINSGKVRTTDRISGPNYDSLRHLVSRALDVNPATRITVLGMRLHPFLLASTTRRRSQPEAQVEQQVEARSNDDTSTTISAWDPDKLALASIAARKSCLFSLADSSREFVACGYPGPVFAGTYLLLQSVAAAATTPISAA